MACRGRSPGIRGVEIGVTPDTFLVHGFTGSPASWDKVVAELPQQQRTSRITLVGHGPDAGRSTFAAEVARVAEQIRAAGSGPVHLCGYSMGGRVSLGVALEAPELIGQLTLIGAHPGISNAAAAERATRKEQEDVWIRLLRQKGIEDFGRAWESQPLFASQKTLPPEVLESQRQRWLSHRAEGLARAIEVLGLSRMPCYEDELCRLTMPITVVAGEQDTKFCTIGARMVQATSSATLLTVPAAGHNVVLERPQVVAMLLRGVLE